MYKKVLLIMVVSTMLFIAASAENTCVWEGWWHNDYYGNIHFQSTPSGQSTATFDGYGKYPAGTFEGSTMDNGEYKNCAFKGTWTDTKSNSGEIELTMVSSDHYITGRYTHTDDGVWHNFPTSRPGNLG
ncbi:MAG: hypothetical protein NTY37_10640 [Methanothrix sp.]|nr:hypothetical protein [Methanothrix sp.]